VHRERERGEGERREGERGREREKERDGGHERGRTLECAGSEGRVVNAGAPEAGKRQREWVLSSQKGSLGCELQLPTGDSCGPTCNSSPGQGPLNHLNLRQLVPPEPSTAPPSLTQRQRGPRQLARDPRGACAPPTCPPTAPRSAAAEPRNARLELRILHGARGGSGGLLIRHCSLPTTRGAPGGHMGHTSMKHRILSE